MQDMKPAICRMTRHEVAILEKGGVFGVIALSTCDDGTVILGRLDPRRSTGLTKSQQDDEAAGRERFEYSLRSSQASGWRIVWRGQPYGSMPNAG